MIAQEERKSTLLPKKYDTEGPSAFFKCPRRAKLRIKHNLWRAKLRIKLNRVTVALAPVGAEDQIDSHFDFNGQAVPRDSTHGSVRRA